LLKEVKILAFLAMRGNRQIATRQSHISLLSLPGIHVKALFSPSILISKLLTPWTAKQKDHRILAGGADSSLPLPTVSPMELLSSIDLTRNEIQHGDLLKLLG
jgi:hypothetical protein